MSCCWAYRFELSLSQASIEYQCCIRSAESAISRGSAGCRDGCRVRPRFPMPDLVNPPARRSPSPRWWSYRGVHRTNGGSRNGGSTIPVAFRRRWAGNRKNCSTHSPRPRAQAAKQPRRQSGTRRHYAPRSWGISEGRTYRRSFRCRLRFGHPGKAKHRSTCYLTPVAHDFGRPRKGSPAVSGPIVY